MKPTSQPTIGELRQWFVSLAEQSPGSSAGGLEPGGPLLLEADLLLGHALGLSREKLFTERSSRPDSRRVDVFRALAGRRRAGEPVAYLLGFKEFYSREFSVNPHVLIPRPETELVVDRALEHIRTYRPRRVIDVGTGSGAILCSIAKEMELFDKSLFDDCCFLGIDLSREALETARLNVNAHGLGASVELLQSDLLSALRIEDASPLVIAANPPYIREDEILPRDVAEYEPALALYGGKDGLSVVRRLVDQGAELLKSREGILVFEIGHGQHLEVECIARAAGFIHCDFSDDIQGFTRVAVLSNQRFAGGTR